MTTQSPRTSLLEAATQSLVGLPLGWAVSYAVVSFRLSPAISAMLITGLMFVVSTARGFWIRRAYERRSAIVNAAAERCVARGEIEIVDDSYLSPAAEQFCKLIDEIDECDRKRAVKAVRGAAE